MRKTNSFLASFALLRFSTYEFPAVSSAIAKGFQLPVKKSFSEHLERFYTSLAYQSKQEILSYDLLNNRIKTNKLGLFSYGPNKRFGYVDSTGTAAQNAYSYNIVNKAISELLEKNELFLFWYHKLGQCLSLDKQTKKLLTDYGLSDLDCYLFQCNNLSTWPTIITIFIKNNRIVTTGICCHKNLSMAIEGAISEAKVLRFMHMLQYKPVLELPDTIHAQAIKHIQDINFSVEKQRGKFLFVEHLDIAIADWIKNLQVAVIGKNRYKVITFFSDSLIKCVPNIEKLKYCTNVDIFKQYPIANINEHIDCVVL